MIAPVEDATAPRPFVLAGLSVALAQRSLRNAGLPTLTPFQQTLLYEELTRAIEFAVLQDRRQRGKATVV